ncbi:hypothetical protein ACHAW5_002128 [Stephanodiscus triporus]|uniref:Transmembrane protein n=1 Tax=Stephanodiscus triporus TaxID=2934178 RepID=A0ABD3QQR4_9STRA
MELTEITDAASDRNASGVGGSAVSATRESKGQDDKNGGLLVRPNEIAVYIQRSSVRLDDVLYFLTNVEPARFNFPKPPGLLLSDDAWAALQLRVDHAARNILDPHRYYAAAACVSVLITIVFYAIRPGYDRRSIHATVGEEDRGVDDDEIYDDYIQDDLWEKNHSVDDVVVAELNYLNSNLDRPMWVWRIGLFVSVALLFASVISIVVLMERRNAKIDAEIIRAIEEIRQRFEDEGIGVEYRTRSSHPAGAVFFFFGRYIRPTRVVVFYYLDDDCPPTQRRRAGGDGGRPGTSSRARSFFSDDYQRRYFPPMPARSTDDYNDVLAQSSFSII